MATSKTFWTAIAHHLQVGEDVDQNQSQHCPWRIEAELSRSYNSVHDLTFNDGQVNTFQNGGINQTYALANVRTEPNSMNFGTNVNTTLIILGQIE